MHGNIEYLWNNYPCTFFDEFDHCVVVCEKRMIMVKRMNHILCIKHNETPSHERIICQQIRESSFVLIA